jgi:uncharacterized glyoxalase superfamily protein PhnB
MAKKAATVAAPKPAAKAKPAVPAKSAVPAKPASCTWITPYLTVRSPEETIEFYKKAFGFELLFAHKHEGKVMHAEMTYQGQIFMFGPSSSECPAKSPSELKGTTFTMYVYVEDVDAFAARAKKAGAKMLQPPKDQFYGDRTANFSDGEGHQWIFATHKFDFDPSAAPPAKK